MFKPTELDDTIATVTGNLVSDNEQLRAFATRLKETLDLPLLGLLCGRRVQVVAVEYAGSPRRGITMRAFDGEKRLIASILDLTLPGKSRGARTLAALKRWAGVDAEVVGPEPSEAASSDIVEAYVTKTGPRHVRLRVLGSPQEITYRASGSALYQLVPGQLVRVKPNKRWNHRGVPYISGEVIETRVDIAALGLAPLRIREAGIWKPTDMGPLAMRGSLASLWQDLSAKPRLRFELEELAPGGDSDDPDDDLVFRALELYAGGKLEEAQDALTSLLHRDLRHLEAHAHLGDWSFEPFMLNAALAHYEVGFRIGEQALGPKFDGVLPWELAGNQPFLRCLDGYAQALWRKKRFAEARTAFERLLRLFSDPQDALDAAASWESVDAGQDWTDDISKLRTEEIFELM